MFPQTHNNNNITTVLELEVEQMLHFLSSNSPIPLPTSMDHHHRSSTNSSSKWKPHIEIAPNCPRCASTNTKFCYYNNYSLSQPRYFCKACRRYWTKGGSLRNVPVGGGCRKTRRSKSSRNPHSHASSEDIGIGDGDHQQNQTNASRDIDMAVVFAKFLNQNSTSGGEANNNNNLSTTPESVETETETENDSMVQPLISDHALLVGGDTFEEMRTVDHEVQNFGREELSLSGIDEFEGFLSVDEDVVQDILWSDHHHDAIVSSSNTWQQQQQPSSMMQMHELDQLDSYSLPLNEDCDELLHHVNSSSTVNLISDSWSSWNSFDISTMEVFTSSSGGP